MCCAWIAEGLMQSGFAPEDDMTLRLVERWRGASRDAFLMSRSVAYLQRSGQLRDLDFILSHFDDVDTPGKVSANEDTTLAVATGGVNNGTAGHVIARSGSADAASRRTRGRCGVWAGSASGCMAFIQRAVRLRPSRSIAGRCLRWIWTKPRRSNPSTASGILRAA